VLHALSLAALGESSALTPERFILAQEARADKRLSRIRRDERRIRFALTADRKILI
jgi:hypothetical protein